MYINVNQFQNCACDSDMIQAALDAAVKTGQSVLVPKYNERTGKPIWEITKTVLLHDESVLLLQNCHLRLADGVVCNMFANENARKPIALEPEGTQRNIQIRGIGNVLLDGGNHNGVYEDNGISRKVVKPSPYNATQNCMFFLQNIENLLIENIKIKDQRYWGIALFKVCYSRIANIRFESTSNVPNQDGVDLLKGCHDVIVENITGSIGDNIVAILATEHDLYQNVTKTLREGDVRNITIRNVMAYGVNGCSLIRLLNHDGYKIYNVRIDNVIEVSPWSENDAPVATNPDLVIKTDDQGDIIPWRKLIPGEEGYRIESAIIIGESYWYSKEKAKHGDTFGISVSNVMTHGRFGVFINNTLTDSSFDNIRMFGNGYAAVYFGEGHVENVTFSNITYDSDCRPLPADEHIWVEWNKTRADGLSCVYFNGTQVDNVSFRNMRCAAGVESVFGGFGSGSIHCSNIDHRHIHVLSNADGIEANA